MVSVRAGLCASVELNKCQEACTSQVCAHNLLAAEEYRYNRILPT